MPRILLIDDDEDVRETLERLLTLAGHDVVLAAGGAEGIHRLRAEGSDLVITDLIMPEKEGIETIMEIRKTFPDLPIIAISGGARYLGEDESFLDEILSTAEILGANHTLAKPFRSSELLEIIEQAMAEKDQATERGGD